MVHKKRPLTSKQFKNIYSKAPRTCVELIIFENKKILLSKRSIYPYKGFWHFPGGSIWYRERIKETIKRVGQAELGVKVIPEKFLGYVEYMKDGYRHSVSLAFKCKIIGSKKPSPASQSTDVKFFEKTPKNTIKEQKKFLKSIR